MSESFAHIEFNASLTISSTNCPKTVIIHVTKRRSFIVLYSLHSLYPSVYAYMNMRVTMVMLLRHSGHVSITAALAKARMSAGFQRELLARCHETHFTGGVCGCICRSVWRRRRRSWCSCRHLRRRRHCRCAQAATQPCERAWDD